jgi:hypothetical protein
MTYRFSKEDREEMMDFETSYSFRNRAENALNKRWFTLNKKATTIVEKEDHLEVTLQDWYINARHNGKFNAGAHERQHYCNRLQEYYEQEKDNK